MTDTTQDRIWCRRCGIVRNLALPAWCRHGDPRLSAARMELLPTYHPLAKEKA